MCTSLRIITESSQVPGAEPAKVILGRTMEFPVDIDSKAVFVPKGMDLEGFIRDPRYDNEPYPEDWTAPEKGAKGMKWTTKYAAAGTNAYEYDIIIDGVNEEGLAIAALYFPDYAEYNDAKADSEHQYLAPTDLGLYILSQFSSVHDVWEHFEKNEKNIRLANTIIYEFGFPPPLHYVIHDKKGNCMVIETCNKEFQLYDNPIGVFANSPEFPWHMTNLKNYVGITAGNYGSVTIDGVTIHPTGAGSGMLGLPGDVTPPSRFVRATAYSHTAAKVYTAEDGVKMVFHIMNMFDIPYGSEAEVDEDGHKSHIGYTIWTSTTNVNDGIYYFHTFESRQIRYVDIRQCIEEGYKKIQRFSLEGEEIMVPASPV